ncbi:unnamed protein product [Haemonchus placei]|uniref:Potassium channel tetramerisation-type BTB domain-containing protein n=1 Tax=Haemonchus placei TaxID=6290 RepID=A0A3P7U169_HAEPC|nr:unnamed protein product [Haemonchus placei]
MVENIDRFNDNNEVFIDHDPKHFPMVLNFLRDGRIPLPDTVAEIDQLLREAQYFEIPALTDFIESEEQRGPPFFRGDKVVWKDQNFQRALAKVGWRFDGSTSDSLKPLCFMPRSDEIRTCATCGVTTDSFDRNYRTIFELPRNATFAVGEVRKVSANVQDIDLTVLLCMDAIR